MNALKELILANPGWTFALMAVVGALLHWAKKARRGEATWNPFDYFLADHPKHSAGFGAALGAAVWAVAGTDSLAGMQAHMILGAGFMLGFTLDSAVNKASAPNGNHQAGFARLAMLPWLMAAALLAGGLSGCATPLAKPENVAQSAVYTQKLADSAELASTQLLRERLIHSSVAEDIAEYAEQARAAATLARQIYAQRPEVPQDALAVLQAADKAVRMLEQFLLDHNQPLPEATP